ncbi:hypothetical protein NG99_21380 [Erwinia typographi]|uniref:Uncharacterized protein n=1 Tax=Erwinia typographi TaxID=371042 RepID=A0A0A3YS08_9GAMM|nr:hypothetical protein [Erwinia typographi]KGT88314.1 hypothetical protein NG99_21380 [Erwinia typographi]
MKILNINAFERLAAQRLVTIAEVVNAIYAINPNTKVKDLNEDDVEEIQDIRKAVTRNIRYLKIRVGSVNEELDADLAFAAAYDYISEDITPKEIIERIKDAVIAFHYSNDWQNYMMAFGGRSLVEIVGQVRKTGRGQHRKSDEEKGNQKMMGLLIKLLADKHSSGKYGETHKPKISEIYKDVLALAEKEKISDKGIKRATFNAKASAALKAVYDEN